MPVVSFHVEDLEALLGKDVSRETLRETIPRMGADLDDVEGETWSIEFFPDRPDLFTVEGIARALRSYLDIDPGLTTYEVEEPATTIHVDPSVEEVRPVIVGAFVRDVELTEHRLEGLIELQEDLHWGIGSRRSKVAIGVHDADPLTPPFRYLAVEPGEVRFTPLQLDREMDLAEILAEHPKGQEYAAVLADHDRYPVILDDADEVLSFPPIINGVLTTVTTATRNLFLDVTGTDPWAVEKALNILATSLAEGGGRLEAVALQGGHKEVVPDLAPADHELPIGEVNDLLGTTWDSEEVAANLRRMGHGARPDGDEVAVAVPAYRADVLHRVDLVEDVAIGHGYMEFETKRPGVVTYGRALPGSVLAERVRRSLTGQGFLEVLTLTLTNEEEQFEALGRDPEPAVTLKNPITEDHTLLQVRLLPGLLGILRRNVHRDLPQRLFEVGVATPLDGEGRPAPERRVAAVVLAPKVGFTDVKGRVQALTRDLGWEAEVAATEDPAFVPGRVAELQVAGEALGVLGEVHPRTLEAFDLANPAVAFELRLDG